MSRNENQRRLWAKQQNPELVTVEQARELFGNKSLKGLRTHLLNNGAKIYTCKAWPNSAFYARFQVEPLARAYLQEHPQFKERARQYQIRPILPDTNPDDAVQRPKGPIERNIADLGWTADEFIDRWEADITHLDAAISILRRSTSIFRMKSQHAFFLIKTLVDLEVSPVGIPGYRSDRSTFQKAVRDHCSEFNTRPDELMVITIRLYRSTDIGKLSPYEVVPVLFELMQSKNSQAP